MNIIKIPSGVTERELRPVLEPLFDDSLFKDINVSVKREENSFTAYIMRSNNNPWNKKWTPELDKIFPDTYSNGWLYRFGIKEKTAEETNMSIMPANNLGSAAESPDEKAEDLTSATDEFIAEGYNRYQSEELAKAKLAGLDLTILLDKNKNWISMMSDRLYLQRLKK